MITMRNSLCIWLASMFLTVASFGQGLTSVSGTTRDPSGAIIPGATIVLTNANTGAQRSEVSDSQGRYRISQVQPGTYNFTARAPGFTDIAVNRVQLLVNTPASVDLTFEKVGSVANTVEVYAETAQVNMQDASLGNAVGGQVIVQLPFEARNVVGLLAIQPGVIYLGEPNPGALNDPRSGAVDGAKSDQGNVTLDGIDVNDQQNRASFTSVLGVTLDSVQEFRTITMNAGAEYGHSSGAQVTLVTRGGTNVIHGTAYEYLRNTSTSANSFFNNAAGVPRAKLNRNVFGAAVGGPIKRDRLFYFLNYEGRRDTSEGSAIRIVPMATFRQGTFTYINTGGGVSTLTPAQVKANDPAGIGENPAVLSLFNQYPLPNDNSVGDGLNTAGYRFNAPTPLRFNTYVSRFDYILSSKNTIFWRGNLQNQNYANGVPQFPGQAPTSVYLNNNKGFAVGLTTVFSTALVSTFRYGLTRVGNENTGDLTAGYTTFASLDGLYGTTPGTAQIIPANDIHGDVVWTKGPHTISFGGEVLLIHNNISTNSHSYDNASVNAGYLVGDGLPLLVPDAKTSRSYLYQMANILGILSQLTNQVNYDLKGNVLPKGTIIDRTFGEQHYDLYVQDSWKATRGLTISVGFRYGLNPAIKEVNGYNVDTAVPMADFLATRAALAASGQSQALAGAVTYDLTSKTGRGLYPFQRDAAPRVAIAYSPQGAGGFSKALFGGPDKTVIRAGWGMFYDSFGQGLERDFSSVAGFSTAAISPPNQDPIKVPRFTGFYNLPLGAFPAAPPGGFPQTAPLGAELGNGPSTIDDKLIAPYTMNASFSIGRQFKGGFFVEASFVNRQSRRSLVGEDFLAQTNLVDPASGMSYFQAADMLGTMALNNTPVSQVPNIPFWQNMWPGAAGNKLSATQAIYNIFKDTAPDWTTSLYNIDIECNPVCSKLGRNAMFNSQYTGLFGLRSVGVGNYTGLHVTVRKTFSQGYQFDINYTWSKCEDLTSSPESSGMYGGNDVSGMGQIGNTWARSQNKSVCDYDTTHSFSGLAVGELPFGSGKMFLNKSNRLLNGLFAGWQLSGVFTAASGFPVGVVNGVGYPTSWDCQCFATQTGIRPPTQTTKNAPSPSPGIKGGPDIFANPAAAFAAYSPTFAGFIGQRNGVRGQGPLSIDLGLSKRFKLFKLHDQQHSLQFRAEGFNITNTPRFDAASASLTISNLNNFGRYSNTFGSPRVFQFSARYEF